MGNMQTLDRPVARGQAAVLAVPARAAYMATLSIAGLAIVARSWSPPNGYFTAWLFTYDHGPARRSLLGSLLDALAPAGVTHATVEAASLLIAGAVVLLLAVAVTQLAADGDDLDPTRAVLGAAALFSAAGFPHIGVMVVHPDLAVLGLALGAGAAIAARWRGRLGVASALTAVAVLIHEGSLLTLTLWLAVLAGHVAATRGARAIRSGAMVAGPALALAVVVRTWVPRIPAEQLAEQFNHRGDGILSDPIAVWAMYADTGDNLRFSLDYFLAGGAFKLVLGAVAVAPLAALCWWLLRSDGVGWRDLRRSERALFVASAAPLLWCPVAVDYGRWWTYAVLLTVATTLLVLRQRGRSSPPDFTTMCLAGAVPISGLVSGPMNYQAFTWIVERL